MSAPFRHKWLHVAALLLGCHQASSTPGAPPAIGVRCASVERVALQETRTLRGTVVAAPDRDAVVAPQVPGRLVRVLVREGDPVPLGATIAQVENQPLQDALVQARAHLAQAEAAAQNAELAYNRSQHLYERGISARQEVDDATARRSDTQSAVTAARAAVASAALNVERATVRSPIAGVVVRLMRRAGELVDGTPTTPVLEIADPQALELLASAAPSDLVFLRSGQRGEVRFDALPGHRMAAVVRAVSPAVDPVSGVGSVRLTLSADTIRPPFGLFGAVTVETGQRTGVLVVPAAALRSAGVAGSEVVLCEKGRAHVRLVEVGERQAEKVEITRGLAPGDRVVADNLVGLADGSPIAESP